MMIVERIKTNKQIAAAAIIFTFTITMQFIDGLRNIVFVDTNYLSVLAG